MISLYVLTAWLTTITTLCVGIIVYLKSYTGNVNKRWSFMSLSIAIWSFSLGLMFNSADAKSGLIYSRILMIGANFIPVTFYHFILAFLDLEKDKYQKKLLFFSYMVTISLLLVVFTPLLVKSVTYKPLVKCFYPDAGSFFIFYLLLYFGLTGYSCLLMNNAIKRLKGQKNNQIKYVLFASVVGFLGGSTTFPLWYQIDIPPFSSHFVWLYSLTITIAILRYRLMDIKVAVTRTGIFIAVYTLVLGLPFAVAGWLKTLLISFFGSGWWMAPLILMAILGTAGPFIYIYFERKAEAKLLKEQRRYQNILKQASLGMTRIRNLRRLLNLIAHIISKTVKIAYVGIYILNKDSGEYILQVSRDRGRVAVPNLTADNPLMAWLISNRRVLVYEEVKRQMQDSNSIVYKQLEENMRLLFGSVIIPSILEDKFMGLIVLGEKISGQIYTTEDLNVFEVLASQAALAIENAQFYEEAKEMQEQISQAEKMATIGTMADGLSHQINNRFYALSLIAGDSIDTIKMTDTSKCTPEVKRMIDDVNRALERIQSNVIQGGEVVRGMLKYSRRGAEGFEPLELSTILDNTMEMVQFKVKLTELDIVRNFNHIPKIDGNLAQLEEVFFNFIDNAYDAIVDRAQIFKEENYRGRITIYAKPKTDEIMEIVIEDNGIGVKNEDNKKVFTPFFTTKISSRKGTGLGLYVIRRIISEVHKGKISFESQYKAGTRFIVELPIAKG